ncbi:MAG: gliding motility-associated C-terminal domain-containing protein [Chitinophagales bacterium]
MFNRWGERVFNSTAFITEWDGTYKGKDQPIDNFVYYLEATAKANKKQFKISGSITIIR